MRRNHCIRVQAPTNYSRFLDDMSVSLRLAIMLNFDISKVKVAYWPLAMERRLRSISESVLLKTSDINSNNEHYVQPAFMA